MSVSGDDYLMNRVADTSSKEVSLKLESIKHRQTELADTWRRFKKNKTAVIGLVIFSIILGLTLLADVIVPYENATNQVGTERFKAPSEEHIFGTDLYGRDQFARIIHGTRYTLLIGIGAVIIGISCGILFGSVAGYYGGKVDTVIMRIMDTVVCIPFILLALTVVAALGPGLINLLIALMVAYIPSYTRVIRSAILSVVGQDYIEAAKSCGTPDRYIMLKHIIPNAFGVIIVQATMTFGKLIISASTMSFLGMGIQPPTPEWGSMLAEGKDYMLTSPHLVAFPGFAIVLTVLSLNLIGDGLRDALDPRLKD